MRIKLSKQNWRLVGQKMGWLKRAQIETNNGAGVENTGAAKAMGIGPGKITPGSLDRNTGNVDGGMEYNEDVFNSKDKNIRLDQGLSMTELQFNILKEIDQKISYLYEFMSLEKTKAETAWKSTSADNLFGSMTAARGQSGKFRSGPITSESVEDALNNWADIKDYLRNGRNKNSIHVFSISNTMGSERELKNNYTPAQLQRFEKEVAERLQKVESLKGLVRNSFRTFMAGKPQLQNTERFNLDTGVKL